MTGNPAFETAWFADNASAFTGTLSYDEPLSRHTWYRIGGPARVIAVPKSRADLSWLARAIRETRMPFRHLGMGSNVLISDRGFSGLIIKTGKMNLELSSERSGDSITVRTGASVAVSSFLRRAAQEGWAGLEFLTGIPGSIGGVVAMNGGTHLGEARERLTRVEAFFPGDGSSEEGFRVFQGAELRFEYRKNLFLPPEALIWSADWRVSADEPSGVKARIDETLARRKATQPIDLPSCGSVFKNPRQSGKSAWQVIADLGLRGHRLGGAQFSEKHCNFIVNTGEATFSDVKGLIELAKSRARSELGIELEEEVRIITD